MLFVVGLHSLLQVFELVMNVLVYRHIHLSGSSPEHYYALHTGLFLEAADVFANLLGHVPAVGNFLNVVAVQTLCVVVVESGRHGYYLLQLVAYRLNVFGFEHLGIHSCLICVYGEYVPGCELYVVEVC